MKHYFYVITYLTNELQTRWNLECGRKTEQFEESMLKQYIFISCNDLSRAKLEDRLKVRIIKYHKTECDFIDLVSGIPLSLAEIEDQRKEGE